MKLVIKIKLEQAFFKAAGIFADEEIINLYVDGVYSIGSKIVR